MPKKDFKLFDPRRERCIKFELDNKLKKLRIPSRVCKFVLIPDTPKLPARHPGADDRLHETKELPIDHLALLELGESTIKRLYNDKAYKTTLCPKVIFFGSPHETPAELYESHFLKNYVDAMLREKQHSIEFHIAAHGDPEKIGSLCIEARQQIEDFAENFEQFLDLHAGNDSDTIKQRKIDFVFHSCNSAYCELAEGMEDNDIKQSIIENSLIGKFAIKLQELGFTDFTVTGFRGYYGNMLNNRGSYVSSELGSAPEVTLAADAAKFTVTSNGDVILPVNERGKRLNVRFNEEQQEQPEPRAFEINR